MKNLTYLFFFLYAGLAFSQVTLEGRIKDAATKEPLPYCAVGLKNNSRGCLSNEEGVFRINAVLASDSLYVSFVGYEKKLLRAADLARNPVIYLQSKSNSLSEVVVYSNDNYLYDIIARCRKTLFKPKEHQSKVYFVLESGVGAQPVELLECYYNGRFDNTVIRELDFKNGRVGIAPHNNRYFINMNTSRAVSFLNLINTNLHMPVLPLQLNNKKLRKQYRLKLIASYDTLNPLFHISFTPRNNNGKYFSGEAWIDKKTGTLKKISLNVLKTSCHPFVPVFKDFGEIQHVSMQITKTFETINGANLLHHIDFNYQLSYRHRHASAIKSPNRNTVFEVQSKGLMFFYDYNNLFFIPRFEYNHDFSDYRKIASLSYNEGFWNSNQGVEYSDKMKKEIVYFKTNGQLINYKNKIKQHVGETIDSREEGLFFEESYLPWSENQRLSLRNSGIKNDTVVNDNLTRSERYGLKAQLFLDVNNIGDSIQYYSAAIFDVLNTYYNLKEEPLTNCFLNIYFDLFEIERRKMEKVLGSMKLSVPGIDSVYQVSKKNIEAQSAQFARKAEHGRNLKEMEKWNKLVKDALGIDNLAMKQAIRP